VAVKRVPPKVRAYIRMKTARIKREEADLATYMVGVFDAIGIDPSTVALVDDDSGEVVFKKDVVEATTDASG
jgi:hypothetical protein